MTHTAPLGTTPTNGDVIVSWHAINLAHALRYDRQVERDQATRTRVFQNWNRETQHLGHWSPGLLNDISFVHAIFWSLGQEIPEKTSLRTAEGRFTLTDQGWLLTDDADKLCSTDPLGAGVKDAWLRPASVLALPNGMLFRLTPRTQWNAGEPAYALVPLPLPDQLLSFRAFVAEAQMPE